MERIFHPDFAGRKSTAYYSTSKVLWEKSAQNPHEKLTLKAAARQIMMDKLPNFHIDFNGDVKICNKMYCCRFCAPVLKIYIFSDSAGKSTRNPHQNPHDLVHICRCRSPCRNAVDFLPENPGKKGLHLDVI